VDEHTISVFTFSKTFAMTGWRVGYVAAHEPFLTGIRKMILYSTNGVSTPSQWAALEALSLPESALTARNEEYRQRRDLLTEGLRQLGFECEMPQGAFYAFPRGLFIQKDSRKAAARLLDEAHVATVPGVVFGAQGEGHLRISYATSLDLIEHGLAALKKFMA
jgi:aspartate aminotransferase